jgi:hypothetical protein
MYHKFLLPNLGGRDHSVVLGVDRRIILKWSYRNDFEDVKSVALSQDGLGGFCEHRSEVLGFARAGNFLCRLATVSCSNKIVYGLLRSI